MNVVLGFGPQGLPPMILRIVRACDADMRIGAASRRNQIGVAAYPIQVGRVT